MRKRSAKAAKTVSEAPPALRLGFFDASALVKAYVLEPESVSVRRGLSEGIVAVSRLSHVEVASALGRRWREGLLSDKEHAAALAAFATDVERWVIVELTDAVARHACQLIDMHALRAGDAIQLASALEARDRMPGVFGSFVAYDVRLCAAARAEGLTTIEY